MNGNCIEYCDKYIKLKSAELEGCSDDYKMRNTVFSTFNHLSVYFPDAYIHMLKVWGVSDENN
jgi:hypothetical protein